MAKVVLAIVAFGFSVGYLAKMMFGPFVPVVVRVAIIGMSLFFLLHLILGLFSEFAWRVCMFGVTVLAIDTNHEQVQDQQA